MKNKGKMIIILILIIILIAVTIILTNKLISLMTSKEPDDIIVKVDNVIENNLQNTVNENNTTNKIEENVINNTVENNNVENNAVNENNNSINQNVVNNTSTGKEQEVDKETIEKEESSKEKAINIAKNDWGEDSNVYFSYEGIADKKYIVYVRDNATTRVLRIYTIDVSSGTFTVQ